MNSYIPRRKARVMPQTIGGITAHAAGQSLSYTRTQRILSWELSNGAAGWQTIVNLLKGTGERIQQGPLAERFISHSPSSRSAAKSGDGVTKMPIYAQMHNGGPAESITWMRRIVQLQRPRWTTARTRQQPPEGKEETGVSAPLYVRVHCAAPHLECPISWHSAI